ncbi:Clavaminate synthase-like protein [Aspergillus heteromorphus CBS 117.55]|uniref:Clavaminate synthase-like protein n=1 Tax=Aspergillus heteromorphus CBS 117.55 TaxID=1448321 RepID=A0A317WWB4_9EURO|nr:Clavaminate synthase-like protein [Aspergillus heteromorphus CBS 117.55]PWY89108.1 Clavaminate synthase-like protein [Aspergillus heteromorphus CBS 117.55]
MSRLLRIVLRASRTPLRPTSILYRRAYTTSAAPPPSDDTSPSSSLLIPSYLAQADNSPTDPSSPRGNHKYAIDILEKHIKISENGQEPFKVLFSTLRDACKCPRCVDPHSKQRNFRTTDIPLNIKISECNHTAHGMEVRWTNDIAGYDESHISEYSFDYIFNPDYERYEMTTTGKLRERGLWNKAMLKKFQHWISYEDYMKDDEAFSAAMRRLARHGIIFLKDIPNSRELVEKIATRMGPLRNTFYGSTWDVRTVPEAKNVAYTNQFLNFHMDLMYMNQPPGFQLLHCLENSCDGGESLFSDTFATAFYMYYAQRELFNALTKFNLMYEYNHDQHRYSRKWPVFQTKEMRGKQPDSDSEITIYRVNYSPPFQAPLTRHMINQIRDDEVEINFKALDFFARRLESPEHVFELKLKPGQCVIFENRRVAHARRGFNTSEGRRWLAGAYVDDEDVISKFRELRKAYPDIWRTREEKQREDARISRCNGNDISRLLDPSKTAESLRNWWER